MRVASLSFFIMISVLQLSHAADLTGDWVGTITFAQKPLPMRLHFETKDENLTGAITIPTERILNSSLANIKSDLNKFHFELETPSGPMNFDGTLNENSIQGTLKQKELQGNMVFPDGDHALLLRKTGSIQEYFYSNHFVPGFFQLMVQWIQERTGPTK